MSLPTVRVRAALGRGGAARLNAERGRLLAKRRQILDAALASRMAAIGSGGMPSRGDERGNLASRGRGRGRAQRKRARSVSPVPDPCEHPPHREVDPALVAERDVTTLNTAVLAENVAAEQPDWWLDL